MAAGAADPGRDRGLHRFSDAAGALLAGGRSGGARRDGGAAAPGAAGSRSAGGVTVAPIDDTGGAGAAPAVQPPAPAPFTAEQRRYLDELFAGAVRRRPPGQQDAAETAPSVHGVPVDELSREERIKHERNPLDIWDTVLANAAHGRFPEPDDVFRYKFHGLFTPPRCRTEPQSNPATSLSLVSASGEDSEVSASTNRNLTTGRPRPSPPTENMCRLRVLANQISSRQLRGLAALAAEYAGGYADLTTRGNLQLCEVGARHAPDLLMGLYDLGLSSRGAGADNIRNVTATPTSGFDPRELCDVRPQARAAPLHPAQPRPVWAAAQIQRGVRQRRPGECGRAGTNDIALRAVRVPEQGTPVGAGAGAGTEPAPGVYFRVLLGGITGHGSFGSNAGIAVPPICVVHLNRSFRYPNRRAGAAGPPQFLSKDGCRAWYPCHCASPDSPHQVFFAISVVVTVPQVSVVAVVERRNWSSVKLPLTFVGVWSPQPPTDPSSIAAEDSAMLSLPFASTVPAKGCSAAISVPGSTSDIEISMSEPSCVTTARTLGRTADVPPPSVATVTSPR